jgi:hypothetical protein
VKQLLQLAMLVVALVMAAGSAATAEDHVDRLRPRAGFDLSCQTVVLSRLDENTYGAAGCGRKAAYIWTCKNDKLEDTCAWVMNGASQSFAPDTATTNATPSQGNVGTEASVTNAP